MLCEKCKERQATCHYMINQNGQSSEAHLCAECAQDYNQQHEELLSGMFPLADLFRFGGMTPFSAFVPAVTMLPVAGWPMLPRQGWTETPQIQQPAAPAADPEFAARREAAQLRRQMRAAVASEDFETAAKLRDQIKQLETSSDKPKET